ncbi:3-phosphoshikimate 1-carboxyvinyltransferase [Alteromonas facilis]|uniref:3-phosphoshikimate 1-carboxyvinyltransferase n=1 Tax=Alteromonas facilis TaxID=2048004 RepID=UPI001F0CD5B5|nr:3-phosphoshikimate 1-carboxyvinyltransferase [Alteromonas facilis]
MTQHPKDDPVVKQLLQRMPSNISSTFSTEQLIGLRSAIGVRGTKLHGVDIRTTFKVPLFPFSFYMVFLMGKDKRSLSEKEKGFAIIFFIIAMSLVATSLLLLIALILYLLKSALGINLFDEYSLGLWEWFNKS